MLGLAAILGATGIGLIYTGSKIQGSKDYKKAEKAYETYRNNLEAVGADNLNVKEVLDELERTGRISLEDHDKALKEYETAIKQFNDSDPDFFYKHALLPNNRIASTAKLFEVLSENVDLFAYAGKKTADELAGDIKEQFYANLPNIANAPTPEYLDVNFENNQMTVDPVKLWSGQEMADLHSIDYDPNVYYDLIKQGTAANVVRDKYTSEQLNQASMYADTKNVNSYLDMIRNSKAEALANGATAGQRAAAEVLANQTAINNYAAGQGTLAQDRYDTISESLLADAQAKLTARDYFNTLAQGLSTDAATLYANDSVRFGGEWAANANMFAGDEALRQARIKANAEMYANYANANSAINNYRNNAKAQADEYAFVFDRFYSANKGDIAKAYADMSKYITNRYTGYNSLVDKYRDENV